MDKEKKYQVNKKEGYWQVVNDNGAVLGVSGLDMVIEQDGYAFKDFNHNGTLEPFEDWRLPAEERIADLTGRMEIDEIAGLMLYSIQQTVARFDPFAQFGYGSSPSEASKMPWDISDSLKELIEEQKMRHITLSMAESAGAAIRWNNNLQALAEQQPLGLPVNVATDPRNAPSIKLAEFTMGASDYLSTWPDNLGMAASFSPELAKKYGEAASREYRAMGISTTLAPQVDLASEPRWNRFFGTFGESSGLSADMARAYCDGFQTSEGEAEIADGWGYHSVNTMVKHWPGGCPGEGGRDAHFAYGKYAVYPGDNFDEHLRPFTEGAFRLDGPTGSASAVMPYYSISYGQDKKNGENVGNAYSRYLITDLLRETYGFDGVVCTDWGVIGDPGETIDTAMCGKSWGVEKLSVPERHYKLIMAGVDQIGGSNDAAPLLEAYQMGVKEHGEEFMQKRFRKSAERILRNIFRTGLMENPYVDIEEASAVIRCEEYKREGHLAQQKSVVLVKNKNSILPLSKKKKVYIPEKVKPESVDWFGQVVPESRFPAIAPEIVRNYFELTDRSEEADAAFVFMDSPVSPSYKKGFVPISLQYRPYTSTKSRKISVAEDRSILGNSACTDNECDLDVLLDTCRKMKGKPVIVFLTAQNPTVMKEFEPFADAIVVDFGVEKEILLELASGDFEPDGLLPCQMPKDMDTVDAQLEDVPLDMEVYTDSCGNSYDFAFGLNWKGVIRDARTEKYAIKK